MNCKIPESRNSVKKEAAVASALNVEALRHSKQSIVEHSVTCHHSFCMKNVGGFESPIMAFT